MADPSALLPPDDYALKTFRQIASVGQFGWVHATFVDPGTAARVVAAHDSLSPDAQEMFRRLPVQRMIDVAYDQARQRVRSGGRGR
jgi:hypothetical protein